MNCPNRFALLSAVMLGLVAGSTTSLVAQTPADPNRSSAAVAPTVDFRSAAWLCDRKIVNNNGEDIAEVSELIMDRGSGRIEYAVIKTGTFLGLGGRAVAVPYASLRWESDGKDRFVLAATPEQLKQFPEYTPESWKALKEPLTDDTSTLRQRLAEDAASPSDPFAGNLDTSRPTRVAGEIVKVERVRSRTYGEQIHITLQAADGTSKKVALGPSWYINGAFAAPMRGEHSVVDAMVLPRDPEGLLAGTHLKTAGRELHLRDSDGHPAWALKAFEYGGQHYAAPYSRFLVLSQVRGMKIDCRGNDTGKVANIILDRTSGEIAFLSIDPNQNFLGIGDSRRLVPWSVATVTLDGTVRIDASKEMVLASPVTPSEPSALNTGNTAEQVYKAFNVPAPRFDVPTAVSAVDPDATGAWSARGSVVQAIEAGSAKTMQGKVLVVSEVKFENGVGAARCLTLQPSGDGSDEELVLLGPSVYLDRQKAVCKAGDSITLEACRTTIGGKRYWLARSIDGKDARVVLLDSGNSPAWSQP